MKKSVQVPLAFREHDLSRDIATERLTCSLCKWTWKTTPQSECPGVPRYEYADIPATLAHKTRLRELHLKPDGPARGVYYRAGQGKKPTRWCLLYAVAEAVPTKSIPSKVSDLIENNLLPERVKASSQQLLDLGLNVFGLHMFLKSVAKCFKPRGDERDAEPLEFEFEYRGTKSVVRLYLGVNLAPEAKGDEFTVLRLKVAAGEPE